MLPTRADASVASPDSATVAAPPRRPAAVQTLGPPPAGCSPSLWNEHEQAASQPEIQTLSNTCKRGLTEASPWPLSPPPLLQSLKELLQNPLITEAKKKEVVKRLATEASFSQYTTNFLNLLIDQVKGPGRARAGPGTDGLPPAPPVLPSRGLNAAGRPASPSKGPHAPSPSPPPSPPTLLLCRTALTRWRRSARCSRPPTAS